MLNEGPEKLLLDEPAGVTQEEELVTLDEIEVYKKKKESFSCGVIFQSCTTYHYEYSITMCS